MEIILETERLILRRPTLADGPFMLRLVNEPSWIQYIGDRNVHTLTEAENYLLNGTMKSFITNGFGFGIVCLKLTEVPIGMCGLVKRDFMEDIDIGFAFFPEYAGMGYAFEVAQATLAYARESLQLKRIVAITTKDNYSSIRLLNKIGLEFEKTINMDGDELNLYST